MPLPQVWRSTCLYHKTGPRQSCGAHVELIDGLISDCGKVVAERKEREGWFDVSTLKEPYRLEGKKTMGYELAEQFDWKLPDVILYPTGGGAFAGLLKLKKRGFTTGNESIVLFNTGSGYKYLEALRAGLP